MLWAYCLLLAASWIRRGGYQRWHDSIGVMVMQEGCVDFVASSVFLRV